MKFLLSTFFLVLSITIIFAQVPDANIKSNAIAIDHIPVVVGDLKSIKKLLSESLHFKVKAGRPHEGIENCFIKFRDGTYLEFTMPLDSTPGIGRYYTRFLKQRQGGTAMAISVQSAERLKNDLRARNIPYKDDSNRVWKTVEPTLSDHFYIEYGDKSWKDTPENTTHPNGALALQSVWVVSGDVRADRERYATLGFTDIGKEVWMDLPVRRLTIGSSDLFLVDRRAGSTLTSRFDARDMNGIAGFTLKVSSLSLLKNMVPKSTNTLFNSKRIVCFLNEYNLFIEFIE